MALARVLIQIGTRIIALTWSVFENLCDYNATLVMGKRKFAIKGDCFIFCIIPILIILLLHFAQLEKVRMAIVNEAEYFRSCRPKYRQAGVYSYKQTDCSNYVRNIFKAVLGIDVFGRETGNRGVANIFQSCGHLLINPLNGYPCRGDIVIICGTSHSQPTHCGIVESVLSDNSFIMIHATSGCSTCYSCGADSECGCVKRSRLLSVTEYQNSWGYVEGYIRLTRRWHFIKPNH